ncbi:MAG TPA: NAD(P)H-binding protein [Arenimonas sp.]|uniref:NAD(P)H-binding protein n=1 Tax=Arenimonas sp. TaxID=1872635 RepID=UPI002D7E8A4A|nr:NAD(P)H-binding protein [Arenimonas sp.]HEU0153079.1 NAD(P)H-binding protein [Arenimonas sp.]
MAALRPPAQPVPPALRVLVLGGGGFIGRHAVAALLAQGAAVQVGSRHPERLDRRLPVAAQACPRRRVRFERLLEAQDWAPLLDEVDVVLNCVGILRERGRETYQRVHHEAPAALAEACRRAGRRLVHVSALGLQAPMRSGFLRSKADGEAALRGSGADCCIVRPSLLDAEVGGYGAAWIRRVARWPVHVLPADARGLIAALDVRDLGQALAALAHRPRLATPAGPGEFELGGDTALALGDYLAAMRRRRAARPAWRIVVPGLLARLASHACDLLHLTPFSFGHWELLRRDNVPAANALPGLLGRAPRRVVDDRPPAALGLPPGRQRLTGEVD